MKFCRLTLCSQCRYRVARYAWHIAIYHLRQDAIAVTSKCGASLHSRKPADGSIDARTRSIFQTRKWKESSELLIAYSCTFSMLRFQLSLCKMTPDFVVTTVVSAALINGNVVSDIFCIEQMGLSLMCKWLHHSFVMKCFIISCWKMTFNGCTDEVRN